MSDRRARVLNDGQTSLYIRSGAFMLDEGDVAYLRRKLSRKLAKFQTAIERIGVRFDDVNGPRGGRDKRCRIKVVLKSLPSVYVEERRESVQAAMDRALARVEHTVGQAVQRRRMRPLKRRRGEGEGILRVG
jgi:ribosome-associated translation inhibitor RaiA